MANLKEKIKMHPDIAFFHAPNSRGANVKLNQGGIINKIKGFEQIKVKAEEQRFDELGMINFYGTANKRIRQTRSYHQRFVVIRGFYIYNFRNALEPHKETWSIPAKPVESNTNDVNQKTFVVPKADGDEGKKLEFADKDDITTIQFKRVLSGMCNLKQYINYVNETKS